MNSKTLRGLPSSGWRLISILLLLLSLSPALSAASTWEGSAVAGSLGDFPADSPYCACNSFPINSRVQVQNLENGKTIIVIVSKGLDNPSIFMALSPKAASALGMKTGVAARIRVVNAPAAASDEVPNPNPGSSADPDYNPSVLAYQKPEQNSANSSGKALSSLLGAVDSAAAGKEQKPELDSMPASSAQAPAAPFSTPVSPEPAPVESANLEASDSPKTAASSDSPVIVASEPEPETAAGPAAGTESAAPSETASNAEAEAVPQESDSTAAAVEPEPDSEPASADVEQDTATAAAGPETQAVAENTPALQAAPEPQPETPADAEPQPEPETAAGLVPGTEPATPAAAPAELTAPEESPQLQTAEPLLAVDEKTQALPPAPEAVAAAEPAPEIAPAAPAPEAVAAAEPAPEIATEEPTPAAVEPEPQAALADSAPVAPAAPEPSTAEPEPAAVTDEAQQGELVYSLEPSAPRPPEASAAAAAPAPVPAVPAPVPSSEPEQPSAVSVPASAILPGTTGEPPSLPRIETLDAGRYYVQIGSFTTSEALNRAIGIFKARNYPLVYQTVSSKNGTQYRLLVGPLNKDESGLLVRSVRALGYKDAFLKIGK